MQIGRVVTITFSIALIGAIIGGAVGAGVFYAWRYSSTIDHTPAPALGAAAGAILGAFLAPITAWAFLRRVPLGKALFQMTVGTTIGTIAGLIVDRVGINTHVPIPGGLIGALLGFIAAAIRLRLTTRTRETDQGMESPGGRVPK